MARTTLSKVIIDVLILIICILFPPMQKQCLNDNCYNITKQLAKKLEFLFHVEKYIQDAQKNNDQQAQKVWQTIRADEEKHADLLRNLLISEVKNNNL